MQMTAKNFPCVKNYFDFLHFISMAHGMYKEIWNKLLILHEIIVHISQTTNAYTKFNKTSLSVAMEYGLAISRFFQWNDVGAYCLASIKNVLISAMFFCCSGDLNPFPLEFRDVSKSKSLLNIRLNFTVASPPAKSTTRSVLLFTCFESTETTETTPTWFFHVPQASCQPGWRWRHAARAYIHY